jgi:hypothetical protein
MPQSGVAPLKALLDRVSAKHRRSGEGAERDYRSHLRDWLLAIGWSADRVRVSELYDLLLLDTLGLPAIYIDTKDPNAGITASDRRDILARSRDLPSLVRIVIADGHSYEFYKPGARESTVFTIDGDPDPTAEIAALLDAGAFNELDASAEVLPVREKPARDLLVGGLRSVVPELGGKYAALALDALRETTRIPVFDKFFDEWLAYSYQTTLSGIEDLLSPEHRAGDSWKTVEPTQLLSRTFAGLTRERAQEFIDQVAAAGRGASGVAARTAAIDLLSAVGAIRLFGDQTALVVVTRILLARILQEGPSSPALPGRTTLLERLGSDVQSGALDIYRETRRGLSDYDHALFGLGLYDWWNIPDHSVEAWTASEQRQYRAWEREANGILRKAWALVLRFSFSRAVRDVLREVYENLLPASERSRLGGFYTEEHLVEFLLSLAEYDGEGALVDPSCGSGSFLVAALARHMAVHKPPRSVPGSGMYLEAVGKEITGIDVHPFAAILGQLNVVLNLADVVVRAVPRYTIPAFVHEIDTLADVDEDAPEQRDLEKLAVFNGRVQEVVSRRKAARAVRERKFDWIVGNPPWGGVLQAGGPLSHRRYAKYVTSGGKGDIYSLFMERAAQMLKPGGRMAFITQNRYLSRDYGVRVQELLTGRIVPDFHVEYVIDLGELGGWLFFPEQTTYPCLTIAKLVPAGAPPPSALLLRVTPKVRRRTDLPSIPKFLGELASSLRGAAGKTDLDDSFETFDVNGYRASQKDLVSYSDRIRSWPIPRPPVDPIDDSEEFFTIGELFELVQGATPGGSGDVKGKKIFILTADEAAELAIESRLLVPVVDAEDVSGLMIAKPTKVALYPYRTSGGRIVIEDLGAGIEKETNEAAGRELNSRIAKSKIKYPAAAKYLITHYAELYGRVFENKVLGRKQREWYRWHRPRDPRQLLAKPKIILRRHFTGELASVDMIGVLPLDGCWAMIPNLHSHRWHEFETAVTAKRARVTLVQLLLAVAAEISQQLRIARRYADTTYQGGLLNVRKPDVTTLRLRPAVVLGLID